MEIFGRLRLSDKANKLPDELSGGMKRRLQLACALVGGTRVLMLDEPTSGIDVETRHELWDLLLVSTFLYTYYDDGSKQTVCLMVSVQRLWTVATTEKSQARC
jgi:energy-coupling factor transporter ATP-binding protein EcfA2